MFAVLIGVYDIEMTGGHLYWLMTDLGLNPNKYITGKLLMV